MGTNYYVKNAKDCPTCGTPNSEDLHIGKSSCGWKFLFDDEFVENVSQGFSGLCIVDEYDDLIDGELLAALIESKQSDKSHIEEFKKYKYISEDDYYEIDGYEVAKFEFN